MRSRNFDMKMPSSLWGVTLILADGWCTAIPVTSSKGCKAEEEEGVEEKGEEEGWRRGTGYIDIWI